MEGWMQAMAAAGESGEVDAESGKSMNMGSMDSAYGGRGGNGEGLGWVVSASVSTTGETSLPGSLLLIPMSEQAYIDDIL